MPKASELREIIENTIQTYGDYDLDFFNLRIDRDYGIVLECRASILEFYNRNKEDENKNKH